MIILLYVYYSFVNNLITQFRMFRTDKSFQVYLLPKFLYVGMMYWIRHLPCTLRLQV